MQDIEDLHQHALLQGSKSYVDPATGFTCFTELVHLQRGKCCGNQCRHCPYGWSNVPNPSIRRTPKVQSGDPGSIQLRLDELERNRQLQQQQPQVNGKSNGKKKKKGGTHGGRLTDKNVPYTGTGDKGTSQLLTGERRSKNDAAFEAMGTVDELCSVVGVAHAFLVERQSTSVDYGDLPEWLLQVMSRLFDAGSHIAKPVSNHHDDDDEDDDDDADTKFKADGVGGGMHMDHIEALEDWIDIMTESLPELRNFILPTGSVTAAQFHVCRTVCRRAERSVVPLVNDGVCDPNVMKYINRLSDFLFTAARWCNYCQNNPEIEYRRPERRDKQRVATARDLNKNGNNNNSNSPSS
ncbi:Cob(I)yrinic acid a,c-diamide adenosyltransferase, mitochondrial [Seminavis robusta]|uniref:Corrinoid adenosyltransferase MMAB n=1 Tax=Seminavis robusta TaxID=568900 RepID=A0A9N8EB67_9STRA|nr:Cob(I)yrinic acid a,c-diamide adenosyltransferase, mitochondrial [Seminavis robusta]|eukprot:Sro757_g197900.1 Cob(I)yrinic acid a,c-diamide adenosyltransferase, mitochondrial (352) ;mRNA; r:8078-9133